MATIGYGDIIPKTHLEIVLVIISSIISTCIFAYAFNVIGDIL